MKNLSFSVRLLSVSVIFLASVQIVSAASFNDLTSYQKQKYWDMWQKECQSLLLDKQYGAYRNCALDVLEKASKLVEEKEAWCTDSDGIDFLKKGVVKTDLKPNGIEDFVYTFPNGSTYLMEGACIGNKYVYYQKTCSELGKKYFADAEAGACVYKNNPPTLDFITDKIIDEGQQLIIQVNGSDPDGDEVTYTFQGLPEGAKYQKNQLSWLPTFDQGGTYEVIVIVSDGELEDSQSFKIIVQNICTEWDKTFGDSNWNVTYSIEQTNDGGYIAAGATQQGDIEKVPAWVFKLDKYGKIEWEKTFEDIKAYWAISAKQSSDGGYIVATSTYTGPKSVSDIKVLKLSASGEIEWHNTFGGEKNEIGYSAQETSDGGFIIAGRTYSKGAGQADAWILKLDKNGSLEWDQTYGYDGNDLINSIFQTNDNGYFVTGYTLSKGNGNYDAWILKLDKNGSLEWDQTYGGNQEELVYTSDQTTDGGYIFVGSTNSKGTGTQSLWVVKINKYGEVKWEKVFSGKNIARGRSIQETSDYGYIVVGDTDVKDGEKFDIWLLKLDKDGTLEWDKKYGGDDHDMGTMVQQTKDGGYVIAGLTLSKGEGKDDAWIIKTDKNGNILCK